MKTLEEISEELKNHNFSEVARNVGVTRSYISALASGTRLNPTYELLVKINVYMESQNNV